MGSPPGVNQAGASGLGWSRSRLHLQRSFAASPRQIEGSATAAPVAQSVKRIPSAHSRSRAKNVDIPSTSFARIIRLGVHFA